METLNENLETLYKFGKVNVELNNIENVVKLKNDKNNNEINFLKNLLIDSKNKLNSILLKISNDNIKHEKIKN